MKEVKPNAHPVVTPKLETERNWSAEGSMIGTLVIGAEQGVVIAGETLGKTKLDGCKQLAAISDATHRSLFINGVQASFAAVDGDKLAKKHSNYMADLRRVSKAIADNTQEFVLGKLSAEGDYAKIMETIPRASGSGGHNKGEGAKGVLEAVKDQIKVEGVESVKDKLAAAPEVPERDKLVQQIAHLHHNDVEAVLVAIAARAKASPVKLHQNIGEMILRELAAEEARIAA